MHVLWARRCIYEVVEEFCRQDDIIFVACFVCVSRCVWVCWGGEIGMGACVCVCVCVCVFFCISQSVGLCVFVVAWVGHGG